MINGDDVIKAYTVHCGELSHAIILARAEIDAKTRLLTEKDKRIAELLTELAAAKAVKPAEEQPSA